MIRKPVEIDCYGGGGETAVDRCVMCLFTLVLVSIVNISFLWSDTKVSNSAGNVCKYFLYLHKCK